MKHCIASRVTFSNIMRMLNRGQNKKKQKCFSLHRKFLCNKKSSAKDAHSRARKMLLSQPRSARESACGLFVLRGKKESRSDIGGPAGFLYAKDTSYKGT